MVPLVLWCPQRRGGVSDDDEEEDDGDDDDEEEEDEEEEDEDDDDDGEGDDDEELARRLDREINGLRARTPRRVSARVLSPTRTGPPPPTGQQVDVVVRLLCAATPCRALTPDECAPCVPRAHAREARLELAAASASRHPAIACPCFSLGLALC